MSSARRDRYDAGSGTTSRDDRHRHRSGQWPNHGYDGYDAQLTAFYGFLTAQANQRAPVAAVNALVDGELKAAAEQKLQAENAAAKEVNNYMNQVSYPVRTAGVDASRLVDFGMSVADCLSEAKSDLGVGGYFGVGFWYVGQYIPYVDIGIDTGAAVGGTVAVGVSCGAHINVAIRYTEESVSRYQRGDSVSLMGFDYPLPELILTQRKLAEAWGCY